MKFGFIGMGNMGQAFLKGMLDFGKVNPKDVSAFAPNQDKLKMNSEKFGFIPKESAVDVVKNSDVIILACKPYQMDDVLDVIGDELKKKQAVSLLAGWDYNRYNEKGQKVLCIMPNTPCSVGEGVILYEDKTSMDENTKADLINLFSAFAKVIELPGELMDAASAISGCAPAFVDVFIEAMADGAVKNGVPRKMAYEIITKMMMGSAKLMEETGLHPGELKDQVCSPKGTTIKGIYALEKGGFRASVMDAVIKVCE